MWLASCQYTGILAMVYCIKSLHNKGTVKKLNDQSEVSSQDLTYCELW